MIKVGMLVDNINLDPVTENLWLAGFPQALEFVKHTKNFSHPSPSQILTLQLREQSTSGEPFPDYEAREVYKNDGREVSGASSALFYKDRLLVGSVFSNMVYCEVKYY